MDQNDREQFWQTLCSLPGNDIVAEREQLFKSIKYPKLLFRYRPVSTKSLEALRTNKLYFSSANYYDDPFDTFLHPEDNDFCCGAHGSVPLGFFVCYSL